MKNFECILFVVESSAAFATIKGRIELVFRTLVSIGEPIGIGLHPKHRGALAWFRSSFLGASFAISPLEYFLKL